MGLRLRLSDRPGDAELVPSYSLVAQDAAEALIALGWPVQPHGPDMECWRIGDLVMTDDELLALATRQGVQALTGSGEALTARLR